MTETTADNTSAGAGDRGGSLSLSVVVPAHDEAGSIAGTLEGIVRALEAAGIE